MTNTTVKFIVENQVFEFSTKCFENPILSDSMLSTLTKETWGFNPDKPIILHDIDSKLFSIISEYILNDCAFISIPDDVDISDIYALCNRLSLDVFKLPNNYTTIAQSIVNKQYIEITSGKLILLTDNGLPAIKHDDKFHFDVIDMDPISGKLIINESSIKGDFNLNEAYDWCIQGNMDIYFLKMDSKNVLYHVDRFGKEIHVQRFDSPIEQYYITDTSGLEKWVFVITYHDIFAYSSLNNYQLVKYFDSGDRLQTIGHQYCLIETEEKFSIWDPVQNRITTSIELENFSTKVIGSDILASDNYFLYGFRFDSKNFTINLLWKIPLILDINFSNEKLIFLSFNGKLPEVMTDDVLLKERLACTVLKHYGVENIIHRGQFIILECIHNDIVLYGINVPISNNCLSDLLNFVIL